MSRTGLVLPLWRRAASRLAISVPRLGWLLALAFYAAVVLLFLSDSLLGGKTLLPGDSLFVYDPWRAELPVAWDGPNNPHITDPILQFYPYLHYARQRILSGELPLWNPYILAGTPFIASQQTAVFYPLNLLALLLPLDRGPAFSAAAKLVLTAMGAYLLCRQLGLTFHAALLAGLAWMLSAFNVLFLMFPHVNTTALLPWVLLFALRLFTVDPRLSAPLLGLACGVALLAGHAETLLGFAVVCVPFTAVLFVRVLRANGVRAAASRLALTVVGCLLGIGLSALVMLPFLDYLANSHTLDLRGASASNPFVLPWYYLATLGDVRAFGGVPRPGYWGPVSFYEAVTYVGAIALVLAVFALARVGRDWRVGVLAFSAVLAWAVVSGVQPVFGWVTSLPGFADAPNTRLRFCVEFCLAILAGVGLDSVLAAGRERTRLLTSGRVIAAGGAALVLLGAFLAAWLASISSLLTRHDASVQLHLTSWRLGVGVAHLHLIADAGLLPPDVTVWLTGPTLSAAIFWSAIALVVALTTLAVVHRSANRRLAPLLASLVLASDLILQWRGVNTTVDPALVIPDTPPAIQYLEAQQGWFRVVGSPGMVLVPDTSIALELRDIRGYELPALRRYSGMFQTALASSPLGYQKYIEGVDARQLAYLSLLGVRYLVTTDSREPAGLVSRLEGSTRVLENPAAMPNAFVVTRWVDTTFDGSLGIIADPRFDPLSMAAVEPPEDQSAWRRLLASLPVLTRAVRIPPHPRPEAAPDWPDGLQGASAPDDPIPARVTEVSPERLLVEVTSPANGYLVVTNAYDAGWTAYVNGKQTPVQPCDHGIQAVRVAAGPNTVELVYYPESFRLGLWASVASAAVIAVWLLVGLAARRGSGSARGRSRLERDVPEDHAAGRK